MDFNDTPEEASFRTEVREFVEKEGPKARKAAQPGEGWGGSKEWTKILADRNWIAPAWPKEYGGAGLTVMEQFIFNSELAEARLPRPGGIATGFAGPTLIVHGTEEQKERLLPEILTGETVWCQGYSEPGAGSDLASLQTRAVRDGDDYVVNGQKIWTSGAHISDWMILLARTDPTAPKHKGLSYFLLDMKTPGISLAPIINMAGNSGFNHVYFDNVRLPARNIVGEENRGWYVAATTLDFERSLVDLCVEYEAILREIIAFAREAKLPGMSAEVRHGLVEMLIEVQVARNLSLRVVSMQSTGRQPNYEASIVKLFASELEQRMASVVFHMGGLFSQLTSRHQSQWEPLMGRLGRFQLHSAAATIGGGTSEVQRNIVATRGLGMPRG
jgi:alkylation response protein AidB-like acyl-CoA dehydrogenase